MLAANIHPIAPPSSAALEKSSIFPCSWQSIAPVARLKHKCISTSLKSSLQSIASPEVEKDTTSAQTRVKILSEALPFIQKFRGKTIVVKYGGAAMKSEALQASVIADVVLLSCVGLRIVFVHGGGPEINQWLNKLNIEPNFFE